MHGAEILVPIFFFVTIAAIWGGIILTRHKERMTMIEKGLKAEEMKSLYERKPFMVNPIGSLKWGILFVSIGIGVLLGIWLSENYYHHGGVIPGLMAIFGGTGLIVFYTLAKRLQQ